MFRAFIVSLKKPDWLLFGAVAFLALLGMLNLKSLADSNPQFHSFFIKQAIFIVAGLGTAFAISLLDYRLLRSRSGLIFLLWVLAVIALVLPMLIGVRVRGAASWVTFAGIFFQPIEFVKIVLLVVLAKYFAGRSRELVRTGHLVASGAYVAIPAGIAVLQPDLGSAILFAMVWFAVVALLGLPLRRIAALCAVFVAIAAILWTAGLAPYQRQRIVTFFSPTPHALGAGYQVKQSLIAIGSGGFLGRGIEGALHVRLGMLPESATDFSFAALVEQIGFVGAVFMLAAFAVILWRTLRVAFLATNNFSRAYAAGFAALLCAETAINIGMNLGLLPVTGLPLPFVSYGGSHIIATCIGLGFLESIRRHQPQMLASAPAFEYSLEDFSQESTVRQENFV